MLAYACAPGWGSEPGIGWNWALQAAQRYDTWVIVEGVKYGPPVKQYLEQHGPIPGLTFLFLPRDGWIRKIGSVPGLSYLSYNLWHRRALKYARQLHQEIQFDLVHQVTFCGYREPGYLWKLGIPFVWGPVGGTQNYPWRFLPVAGFRGALSETLRTTLNWVQLHWSPRIGRAVRSATALLAANTTIERDFARAQGRTPEILLETGVRQQQLREPEPAASNGPVRLLWSGDLSPWKALPLLLRALAALPDDVPYKLTILGKGPLQGSWQRLAKRLGLSEHITWKGWVPYEDALKQYAGADLFVFTSLRDTTGNVVLEALANGVPVIGLNHQGVRDVVTPECGVKIPVTTPNHVVGEISRAITELARDPDRRSRLARGALDRARYYLWSEQGKRMAAVYRRALESAQPSEQSAHHENSRRSTSRFSQRGKAALRDAVKQSSGWVASGLRRVFGERTWNQVGILVYHRVAPRTAGVDRPTMNVTPEHFREQLSQLRHHGCQFWPLQRLLLHHQKGLPVPPQTVAVTFDDGFESVYVHAWPVLRELQIPATVFLATAYMDGDGPFPFDPWGLTRQRLIPPGSYRPLRWGQCREMRSHGLIELGAHTHTHGDFRGQAELFEEDLATCVKVLREQLGMGEVSFAFPFGRRHTGFSGSELMEAARRVGVTCALTTEAEPVDVQSDPFGWGRFNVYEFDTGETIVAKLEGWYGWAPRLQGWLSSWRNGAKHGGVLGQNGTGSNHGGRAAT